MQLVSCSCFDVLVTRFKLDRSLTKAMKTFWTAIFASYAYNPFGMHWSAIRLIPDFPKVDYSIGPTERPEWHRAVKGWKQSMAAGPIKIFHLASDPRLLTRAAWQWTNGNIREVSISWHVRTLNYRPIEFSLADRSSSVRSFQPKLKKQIIQSKRIQPGSDSECCMHAYKCLTFEVSGKLLVNKLPSDR